MKRQTTILAISAIASLILTNNVYAKDWQHSDKLELLPPASPFSFQNQITKDTKSPLIKVAYNPAMEVKPTLNLNQPITQISNTSKPTKTFRQQKNASKFVMFRGKKISATLAALYDSPLN
jgi:hypothetical protein